MEVALTDLPSKGLVYDVPLANIIVRTMCGGDEKLLAELSIENIEMKYLALMKNRIKSGESLVRGIDPAKLTLGDRLYILLWQRINSFSPKFKSNLVCQNCFKDVNLEIDLTKINETYLPEGFKEPYEVVLSEGKVNLRLFRVEDEIKAYDKEKKDGIEKVYLYRLALTIVDSTKSVEDRIAFLESLPTIDLAKIKYFHELHVHGPQLNNIQYTCPKCQEVGQLSLPFRSTWLIPSGTEVN